VRHGSYTSDLGEICEALLLATRIRQSVVVPRLNCGEPRMTPFLLQLALMLVVILLAAELFTNALEHLFPDR